MAQKGKKLHQMTQSKPRRLNLMIKSTCSPLLHLACLRATKTIKIRRVGALRKTKTKRVPRMNTTTWSYLLPKS